MENPAKPKDLSTEIAEDVRRAIISGELDIDARLPSEAEMAEHFNVSRSTVREALKRLAAQSLIRTQRGATGGAFVKRISYQDAYPQHITTSTLLLSMNAVSFETACEARFALERACAHLAASRRTDAHLATMRAEIARQRADDLTDEAFCASDVTFHRAFVDAAQNPVLSYQLAGAVEAMQPLMNMITFSARDRSLIAALHEDVADAVHARDRHATTVSLITLEGETQKMAQKLFAARAARRSGSNSATPA